MLKNDSTIFDSYERTDKLDWTATVTGDKKEIPRVAFLKISSDRKLQHICNSHMPGHNQNLQKSCNLANAQIKNCLTNKNKSK